MGISLKGTAGSQFFGRHSATNVPDIAGNPDHRQRKDKHPPLVLFTAGSSQITHEREQEMVVLVTSASTTNFGFSCTPKEQPRRWQAVSECPRAGCRTRREPTPPVPPRGAWWWWWPWRDSPPSARPLAPTARKLHQNHTSKSRTAWLELVIGGNASCTQSRAYKELVSDEGLPKAPR